MATKTASKSAICEVFRLHRELNAIRATAESEIAMKEQALSGAVWVFVSTHPDSLRGLARRMSISAPYLSDIANGRRKVSDEIIQKLGKLK